VTSRITKGFKIQRNLGINRGVHKAWGTNAECDDRRPCVHLDRRRSRTLPKQSVQSPAEVRACGQQATRHHCEYALPRVGIAPLVRRRRPIGTPSWPQNYRRPGWPRSFHSSAHCREKRPPIGWRRRCRRSSLVLGHRQQPSRPADNRSGGALHRHCAPCRQETDLGTREQSRSFPMASRSRRWNTSS